MEEHDQLQDWELLSSSSADDSKSVHGVDQADEEDAVREEISSDYFALNVAEPQFHHDPPAVAVSSEESSQEGGGCAGIDSDNPESDSSSVEKLVLGAEEILHEGVERGHAEEHGHVSFGELSKTVHDSDSGTEMDAENDTNPKGREKKREAAAWWKMPFEILRLYVSRVKPVWSIPVAAAVLGFVILGRKLYRMRHKGRKVPLRITVDDKRAQFISHAGPFNEALFAVKHVPIIRTSLAAGSVMQWPTASLR